MPSPDRAVRAVYRGQTATYRIGHIHIALTTSAVVHCPVFLVFLVLPRTFYAADESILREPLCHCFLSSMASVGLHASSFLLSVPSRLMLSPVLSDHPCSVYPQNCFRSVTHEVFWGATTVIGVWARRTFSVCRYGYCLWLHCAHTLN